MTLFKLTKPFLHALDPERAHKLAIFAMKHGLYERPKQIDYPSLHTSICGLDFINPIGLAAGFDKNAEVMTACLKIGFGFTEIGTVTPLPQDGNPRPRIFRDKKNQAIINRMGFPNKGITTFKNNVKNFTKDVGRPTGIIGLNIGMNKTQTEPADDYALLIKELGSLADYFTVNISSPNTPGLRNLQSRDHFMPLINAIKTARKHHCDSENPPPIFVKLAPDLDEEQQAELATCTLESGIDGLILGNTTLSRPTTLPPKFTDQAGGLSGQPLTDKSTEIIGNFYKLTKGKIPIIGVGGVSSAAQAYDKIKAGASLIQLYSALIFQGPDLVAKINEELVELLEQDGYESIKDAVGVGHRLT